MAERQRIWPIGPTASYPASGALVNDQVVVPEGGRKVPTQHPHEAGIGHVLNACDGYPRSATATAPFVCASPGSDPPRPDRAPRSAPAASAGAGRGAHDSPFRKLRPSGSDANVVGEPRPSERSHHLGRCVTRTTGRMSDATAWTSAESQSIRDGERGGHSRAGTTARFRRRRARPVTGRQAPLLRARHLCLVVTSGHGRKFVGGSGPGGRVGQVEAAGGVEGVFGGAAHRAGG